MRKTLGGATAALLVALLLLAASAGSVSRSVGSLADDLASGTFSPFGPPSEPGRGLGLGGGSAIGGITGRSDGNYVPGAGGIPEPWVMDRSGLVGDVVIDYVFQPALGSMKRLKAYDSIGPAPGYAMGVADGDLRAAVPRQGLTYDQTFRGSFDVVLRDGRPTPIFSPAPDALVVEHAARPPVPGLQILKDGTDTYHAVAPDGFTGRVRINVTYQVPSSYYSMPPFAGGTLDDYPPEVRPSVDATTRERALLVLARAGVQPETLEYARDPDAARGASDVAVVLRTLQNYFLQFGEGDIPGPGVYDDLYLALGLGENGCCRHRAFAYAVTAQALGVPTRVVVNEAHAFVEVMLPQGTWHQLNLGGCGSYRVNNPFDRTPFSRLAGAPRAEEPDEGPPTNTFATRIEVRDVPESVPKGQPVELRGRVVALVPERGEIPVPRGVKVDVYLNGTDRPTGRLVGAGTTDEAGAFAVRLNVGRLVAPGAYDLVARALDHRDGSIRYVGSWTEGEPVAVTSPTRLGVEAPARDGIGAAVPVRARLSDALDAPVAGQGVSLVLDGRVVDERETNETGRVEFEIVFADTGEHSLVVRFDGGPYLGRSQASTVVVVGPHAVDVDPDLAVVRGEPWRLEGAVLSGGGGVVGAEVLVTLDGFGVRRAEAPAGGPRLQALSLTTGAGGRFGVDLVLPPDVDTGTRAVTFAVGELGLEKRVPVEVQHRPVLRADGPAEVYLDEAAEWALAVRLVSDRGEPVPYAPLAIALGPPGGVAEWRETETNATGGVTVGLAPPLPPPGPFAVSLRFNGTGTAAPSTLLVNVTVHAGSPPLWGVAWLPAALGVGGAAIVGGVLAAVAARRGGGLGRAVGRALLAARVREPVRVAIEFPGLSPSLPPVWTPGEPLLVRVRATRLPRGAPRPLAGVEVTVTADGARASEPLRARTDADGVASVQLRLADEGVVTVRARARGSLARAPGYASRLVRAADYRRELEREYRALAARAREAGAPLTDASTPREVAAILAAWAPQADAADVEEVVARYEDAEFTERPVTRREFSSFVLAAQRIEAAATGGEVAVAPA